MFALFFFFSSRRRHTRWPRDWSSDVCSSDLPEFGRGDGVDGLIELKGLLGRQVPEQLLLVAEHERDAPLERRSEEHTSELQSRGHLVCRLLLEKKKKIRDDEVT